MFQMKQTLLRIGSALIVSVSCGLVGALVGLGWSFIAPPQYTSTAHIGVHTGGFAGDRQAVMAYLQTLVDAAQDPQAMSIVIAAKDLYHVENAGPIHPLVAQFKQALRIQTHTGGWNTAWIELSFSYTDPMKVQGALNRVIRFLVDAGLQPISPNMSNASVPVRTKGLDQETWVLLGFIAGLLICATGSQLRRPAAAAPVTV